MAERAPTDVLVLGEGIAGLLAVAAARAAGLSATVVERAPVERAAGVPHAAQLHNLLGRGQRELERMLPGILAELPRFDGVAARISTDTYVFEAGRRGTERDTGRDLWGIPRIRLEDAIRARAETAGAPVAGRVVGLEVDGARCVGAWIEEQDGVPVLHRAGLVVDAMGASTPAPGWLRAAGHDIPQIVLPVRQWYASAGVRGEHAPGRFVMVFPTGEGTRGGLASPRAGGGHVVSLNGMDADPPPATAADFAAYAATLPDPEISRLLDGAEIERPRVFRRPRAVWNRHDQHPVDGFIAVGDASSAPNPLLGHGISGAAWEARVLRDALAGSPRATA